MPEVQPARLLEAREWIGFTREQVAARCGWDVDRVITLEDGTGGRPTSLELAKLVKLYRRPLWWLCGETRFQPSEDLLHKVEGLDPGDREVILDFAEWLQDAGPAPRRETRNA